MGVLIDLLVWELTSVKVYYMFLVVPGDHAGFFCNSLMWYTTFDIAVHGIIVLFIKALQHKC